MGSPTTLDQFQRFVKLGFGVVRQCQHDVAADVRKPCALRGGKCSPRLLCRVRSAQCAQLGIPGRLHPERDAVHARLPEACKAFFRHRLRVCFQCDLGPRHRPGRIDEPFCLLRAQQAGRAAAKIKGVRLQRCFRRKAGKLPQKSIHISFRYAALTGMGIEIAVSAFWKNSTECVNKAQETYNITAFFMKRSFLCSILYSVDRSKEKVFRQKETGGVPYGLQLQWLRSRLHGACHDLG